MRKHGFDINELKRKIKYFSNKDVICYYGLKEASEYVSYYRNLINICNPSVSCNDYEADDYEYEDMDDLLFLIKNGVYNKNEGIMYNIQDEICSLLYNMFEGKSQVYRFRNLNLPLKCEIQLVYDMIKSKLGKKQYESFKRFFIDNPTHVQFTKNFDSATANFRDDIYVIIYKHSDIAEVTEIAHEAGHTFYEMNFGKGTEDRNSVLGEVESTFYELLMFDFLIEENIYKEEAKKCALELIYINEKYGTILNANKLCDFSKLETVQDFKNVANKLNLYKRMNLTSDIDVMHDVIDIALEQDGFMYVYSYLVALEFYYQYKNSKKELIIPKFEKFLSNIGKISDFELSKMITNDNITFNNLEKFKQYKKSI